MRRELAAAVLGVLVCAGCGVPQDETPRSLPTHDVPFDLLAPSGSPSASPVATGRRSLRVFLVRGDRVTGAVRRSLQALTPADVMTALMSGAVGSEPSRGLRSAIPAATEVLALDLDAGTATVDLSTEFTSVGSEQQILAIAQIVYSLTELPEVQRVRLLIDGQQVQVPREDGSLSSEPLVRADYDGVVE